MSDSEPDNPFASPQFAAGAGHLHAIRTGKIELRRRIVRYQSGHGRAVATICSCLLMIVGCGGLIVIDIELLNALHYRAKLVSDMSNPIGPANQTVGFQSAVSLLLFASALCGSIAYFFWLHRVYRNLPALGAERLTQSPASAVGWHFVPLANFVLPMISMNEIAQGSDRYGLREDDGMYPGHTTLIVCWWALNLITGLMPLFAPRPASGFPINDLIYLTQFEIAHTVALIVMLLSTIVLIWQIDQMQTERSESLVEIQVEPTGETDEPDQIDWSAFQPDE